MHFLKTAAALVATFALSVTAAPTDVVNIQAPRDDKDPATHSVQCGWFYYSGEGQEQPLYANGHAENLEVKLRPGYEVVDLTQRGRLPVSDELRESPCRYFCVHLPHRERVTNFVPEP